MNPYDEDYSDKVIYDEEQIIKILKDMHEDEGLRCTECGEFLTEVEIYDGKGMHFIGGIVIEEGEYGEPDKVHILCPKCLKKYGFKVEVQE